MDLVELLTLDDAELFVRYGRETGAGAAEPDPEAGGRARFNIFIANMRGKLCSDPRIRAFLAGGVVSDKAALCAVVLEILTSLSGAQMPRTADSRRSDRKGRLGFDLPSGAALR